MQSIGKILGISKVETSLKVPTIGKVDDKIKLVSIQPHSLVHSSATPFGSKIEIMLRIAGLPYEAYPGNVQDKKMAPKEKLPVLYHGQNVVPDSDAIVEYLNNTYPNEMAVFTPSNPQSKVLADLCKRTLQEHTYFCLLYMAWQVDENFEQYGKILFRDIPSIIRSPVMNFAQSTVKRTLKGQGIGRHSYDEVMDKVREDFDNFDVLLTGTGQYLTGSTPTAADCFLWAMIDPMMGEPTDNEIANPIKDVVQSKSGLVAFYKRMKAEVFPDGPSTKWKDGMFNVEEHFLEVAV